MTLDVDWQNFTPYSALIGGILIGLAAVILILINGRIAGVSGILGELLQPQPKGERRWRVVFIIGLLISPWIYGFFQVYPIAQIEANNVQLIIAGVLVGVGTRYGAGCTSGHGICGLSRLSLRSLTATMCFMLAGFMAVYVIRHLMAG